jgi:hypothetical protein
VSAVRWIPGKVQAVYDAMSDDKKAEFNDLLQKASRTLADMRVTKKGEFDKRLLTPSKVIVPHNNKRASDGRYIPKDIVDDDDDDDETKEKSSWCRAGIKLGDKLPEGKDLGAYIKEKLGDGKVLADFYINVLQLTGKTARKAGVYMNHKLQAADWLGNRGWGRVKGDEEKAAIQINVVDYANANVPSAPKIVSVATKIDADIGRDLPQIIDEERKTRLNGEPPKWNVDGCSCEPQDNDRCEYCKSTGVVPDVEVFDITVDDVKRDGL